MSLLSPERIVPGTSEWEMGVPDHIQRYEFASEICIGKKVLDAACGVGYGSAFIADKGAKSVYAIDISNEAIMKAKSLFARNNITFNVDDCEKISSVDNHSIDIITALECFEHLRKPLKFLERCSDILVDDGTLILSTPNVKSLGRSNYGVPLNPFHIHEYTYDELLNCLRQYFDDITIYYQMKSPILELHEDVSRFVNFAYRNSPYLRLSLKIRQLLRRPGHDPIIRPYIFSKNDFQILSKVNNPDRTWVFVAICRKPIRVK